MIRRVAFVSGYVLLCTGVLLGIPMAYVGYRLARWSDRPDEEADW